MLRAPTPQLKPVYENHKRKVMYNKYFYGLPFREIAKAVRAAMLHGVADRICREKAVFYDRGTLSFRLQYLQFRRIVTLRHASAGLDDQIHNPSPNGAESVQMSGVSTRKPAVAERTTTMSSSFHFSPRLPGQQTPTDDRRIQRGAILSGVQFAESHAPDFDVHALHAVVL